MSLTFANALSQYVELGDIATARFEIGEIWTVLSFMRVGETGSDDRSIVSKFGGTNKNQFLLRTDRDSTPPTNLEVYTQANLAIAGGNNIALDTWYLIAVSNDGTGGASGMKLYSVQMDGTFLDDAATGQHTGDESDLTGLITFSETEANTDEFAGDLDYECYIQKELTKQEILRYLHDPVGAMLRLKPNGVPYCIKLGYLGKSSFDLSGSKNHGTIFGSVSRGEDPPTVLSPVPITFPESSLVRVSAGIFGDLGAPAGGRVMSSLVASGGLANKGGIAGEGGGLAG